MSELAFFTTRDLIEELIRRKTFLGVVVQAEEDYRSGSWDGDRYFNIHFNENLERAQVSRLLEVVSDQMERLAS